MMNQMMQETLLTGTARKAELPGWQAAGKTGTSQDWRDAWFLGYTSYLVAGVWLGNDDSSPTKKVSGGNLPVEIWSRFMKAAHEGVPVAGLPAGSWRSADAPNPEAALAPPLSLTGSQMGTGGRGGRAPQPTPASPDSFTPQARAVGPRGAPGSGGEDGDLLPPAEIPNAGRGPVARGKGLLDKLLGTP
jgi:penicillin-binding protein 1A